MELYDLSRDPAEKNNVAEKYPDVAEELKEKLEAWNAELPKSYEKLEKKNNNRKKK